MTTETQVAEKAGSTLISVFSQTNSAGKYIYSNEDAFHALLLLVFQMKIDVKTAPEGIQGVVAKFIERTKLPADATPKQLNDAITGYFAKYPINPQLKAQLEHAFKEIGNSVTALGHTKSRESTQFEK